MNTKMRLPLVLAWALLLPAMAQAEQMLVNPNTADKDELQALPNIGDEIARRTPEPALRLCDAVPFLQGCEIAHEQVLRQVFRLVATDTACEVSEHALVQCFIQRVNSHFFLHP